MEIMAHCALQGRLRYSTTSEGSGVLPVLSSHHALRTLQEHHLPLPLFPLCRQYVYTIRDDRRGLFAALVYFLRFLRFLRSTLSLKTSDWWGRWLDQVKDAPAPSKSTNRLPSLCSTQRHNGALRQTLPYYGERNLCAGDPVSHHRSLRAGCTTAA